MRKRGIAGWIDQHCKPFEHAKKGEHLLMPVRHKTGHFATEDQLNALIDIAAATKMDESWFGHIVIAKTQSGKEVHVVRDRERESWLTLKYAVKLVNEGISSPRDYLDEIGAEQFESLLKNLEIVPKDIDEKTYWKARFVSDSNVKIAKIMKRVMDKDSLHFRFRPMKISRGSDSGLYYIDLGDRGDWSSSMCLWFAKNNGIAFDVYFMRYGAKDYFNHVVYNGREVLLAETADSMRRTLSLEDIVSDKKE